MKKYAILLALVVIVLVCSCSTLNSPEKTLKEKGYAILFNTTDKDYSFKVDAEDVSRIGTVESHSALVVEKIPKGAELKVYDAKSNLWFETQIPELEIVDVNRESINATVPVLAMENDGLTLMDTWTRTLSRDFDEEKEALNISADVLYTEDRSWSSADSKIEPPRKHILAIILGSLAGALVTIIAIGTLI